MTGPVKTSTTLGMSPAEAAAYWHVRRDGRDLTDAEQMAFDDWIDQSPAHARQFARMSELETFCEQHADDPLLSALRQEALAVPPARRHWFWRVGAGGLVAASLALGVFLLRPDAPVGDAPVSVAASAEIVHTTRKGELRTVRLSDGSTVTLNTDSELRVKFTGQRRTVQLVHGQALFAVAHDAARPFVVEAADRTVTALGTVFEVRLDPGRMEVTLVDGKVAVNRPRSGHSEQPAATVLRPGEELVVELGMAQRVEKVDVGVKLRWRDGFVEFADAPLGEAVVEINRYSVQQVTIADEQLARQHISGVFRTGDPARFAAMVGELLPVEARKRADGIELLPAPPRP